MEINKGPIPERFAKPKNNRYDFKSMEVGDWFVVTGIASAESAQNAAYAYGKRSGNGFRLSMRKDGEEYCMTRVK